MNLADFVFPFTMCVSHIFTKNSFLYKKLLSLFDVYTVKTQAQSLFEVYTVKTQAQSLFEVYTVKTQAPSLFEVYTVKTQAQSLFEVYTVKTQLTISVGSIYCKNTTHNLCWKYIL